MEGEFLLDEEHWSSESIQASAHRRRRLPDGVFLGSWVHFIELRIRAVDKRPESVVQPEKQIHRYPIHSLPRYDEGRVGGNEGVVIQNSHLHPSTQSRKDPCYGILPHVVPFPFRAY